MGSRIAARHNPREVTTETKFRRKPSADFKPKHRCWFQGRKGWEGPPNGDRICEAQGSEIRGSNMAGGNIWTAQAAKMSWDTGVHFCAASGCAVNAGGKSARQIAAATGSIA
jgi:hypothetical protein